MILVDWHEAVDQLAQAVRRDEPRIAFRDLEQVPLGKDAKNGDFVNERSVEHEIRLCRERKDVLLLAAPYRRPARDGFAGRVAATVAVAHDSPKQAHVLGEDTREAVQRQCCGGVNEHAERRAAG